MRARISGSKNAANITTKVHFTVNYANDRIGKVALRGQIEFIEK